MEKVAAARSDLVLALDAIWSSGRKRPRLTVRCPRCELEPASGAV